MSALVVALCDVHMVCTLQGTVSSVSDGYDNAHSAKVLLYLTSTSAEQASDTTLSRARLSGVHDMVLAWPPTLGAHLAVAREQIN